MRCRYCHNPDTWKLANAAAVSEQQISENAAHANTVQNTASDSAAPSSVCNYKEMTPSALIRQALRYKRYWGKEGGITVSGGEPLLQIDFMNELFRLAKENGVGTVLDTAGQPFTREDPFFSKLTDLMENTDLVMLDLKHIDPEKHRALTGHTNENILAFARYLNEIGKPMWIRHVLVPGVTDDNENLHGIRAFLDTLSNVKKSGSSSVPYTRHLQMGVPWNPLHLKRCGSADCRHGEAGRRNSGVFEISFLHTDSLIYTCTFL